MPASFCSDCDAVAPSTAAPPSSPPVANTEGLLVATIVLAVVATLAIGALAAYVCMNKKQAAKEVTATARRVLAWRGVEEGTVVMA